MPKIIISCAPRTSSYVLEELKALGYLGKAVNKLGVEVEGTMADAMKFNLYLRSASKVLLEIKSFPAADPTQLYTALSAIAWERIVPANGYLRIESFVKNDTILDTRFANLKTKDAIVDRVMETKGKRPNSGPNVDRTVLFLHWTGQQAGIYINTSGDSISKHGYRKIPFKAPMMESLAASTLLASRWDKRSHFINPMCGSGTLAIEAALLACNIPPGIHRHNYGFMHTRSYDPLLWKKLLHEAKKQIVNELDFKIIATDKDTRAIEAAKKNADTAGVAHLIDFEVCDFKDTFIPSNGPGVVFFNPEYGERLGDEKRLEGVYKAIGDFFKQQCQGYLGYIFTGNLTLAKHVGLKTKKRIEFFNAKIDARLLEYEIYSGSKRN